MADTIKSSYQVKLIAGFVDEDDRTIAIDNPRDNLTWNDIENIEIKAANVLIGDKASAKFSRIKSAKYVDTTITEIELEQ